MSKVAHYLQEHLDGEVVTSSDSREFFSVDNGILSVTPSIVVYPKNEQDVRKATRFSWQLAERGRTIPITPRGLGGNVTGAALGEGMVLVFPTHLDKVIELDGKSGEVVVEPGMNYATLLQVLRTHGRLLPPYPASYHHSTLGGAIATNASGQLSTKYGDTRDYVRKLRVVLANGEVIETRRLSKKELNKKLGLGTLEGEIYRQMDKLIEDNLELLQKLEQEITAPNSSGYALQNIKRADGSFDLTPLIVGSEGTLATITEATLATRPNSSQTTSLVIVRLDEVDTAQAVINELSSMPDGPSRVEMVDARALETIHKQNPSFLKYVAASPFSKITLLVEFDAQSERTRKQQLKKFTKFLSKQGIEFDEHKDEESQVNAWKLRTSVSELLGSNQGDAKALPVLDDGAVAPGKFGELLSGIYELFASHQMPVAVWGSALSCRLQARPIINIGQIGDRQKLFKILSEYYELITKLGGTIAGSNGDGRIAAPFLEATCPPDVYNLFVQTKQIFDPYNIMNPGVKLGTTVEDLKKMAVTRYNTGHMHNFLPHN